MNLFLKSDLFRNFLGGFAIGAVAMFALQPDEGVAHPPVADPMIESTISR
ncbi:hypothetical protein [Blastomonas sp. AAP53]|nr:hypothetical protein [Blastomonas sp. AAP53]